MTIEWMGQSVETLDDLLRPNLTAICVGINPSPVSVAAGHYYQGALGQRLYRRLRKVGMLPSSARGREDDSAFESGVGFTDIVKRPTGSADEVMQAEFEYGRSLLAEKLHNYRPRLVLFAFKETAVKLYGRFRGNGFIHPLAEGVDQFVMPGPFAPSTLVDERMGELRSWLDHVLSPDGQRRRGR